VPGGSRAVACVEQSHADRHTARDGFSYAQVSPDEDYAAIMVESFPADIRSGPLLLVAMSHECLKARLNATLRASKTRNPRIGIAPDCGDFLGTSAGDLELLRVHPHGGDRSMWAVVERASSCMVCLAGFLPARGERAGSVGNHCAIAPPFRRRGFGRDAVTALLSWAREHHAVTRVVATLPADAPASHAFARRLGFDGTSGASEAADQAHPLVMPPSSLNALRPRAERATIPYVTEF
jgi:ribosomal-protein-alanine N-acetyltransferase